MTSKFELLERLAAAEQALSDLKREVLEKVGPFVEAWNSYGTSPSLPDHIHAALGTITIGHFRALSTLYEKLSSIEVRPELPGGDVKNAAGEAGGSGAWRDIDSAPRDGTAILVFAPGRSDRWEGDLGDLICRCAWHPDAGFCVCELREPTHWQPLPPPPNPSARGEL